MDDVYWVSGSVRMAPGMRLNRVMVVVRSGEELALISSVRLSERGEAELERLGKVRHIIRIGLHAMDDAYNVKRFDAQYWTLPSMPVPEGIDRQILAPDSLPIPDASLFIFEETTDEESALLINRGGGILVTCDSVQNWPDSAGCSLLAKGAAKMMGFTARPAQIGPPWRKRMTPEGGSLRSDFERLAALDFKHLIGAHGAPLRETAKHDLLATVAATFD